METLKTVLCIFGVIAAAISIPIEALDDDDWADSWTPVRIATAVVVCVIVACLVLIATLIARG
jgi:hypothetical protein